MRLIWRLARLAVRIFYRATRVGPALPDGPVLLVANHPNALIDPAVIESMAGRPIRFVAKSTLFRGLPLGPLIRRSGAIPVYRRMDAGADISRNVEMFAAVEAALSAGDAVCLFPEGLSHSLGRLAELRTGAARIVLGSAVGGTRVALVPVGLNFERVTRFRSRVTTVFGPAFWCDDLVEPHRQGDPGAVRALTERIGDRLRRLMIEADPRHELQLVHRVDRLYAAARGVSRDVEDQLRRRRLIASGISRLHERDPDRYEAILERINAYDAELARFGLRDRDVDQRLSARAAVVFTVRELLVALVAAPIAAASIAVFVVPYLLTGWLARMQRDMEVRATWQAVGGVVVYGVWIAGLSAVVGFVAGPVAAAGAFVALVALAIAGLAAFERETSVVRTVLAFVAIRQAPLRARARLRRQRSAIASVLDEVQEWLSADPRPTS